jgi:Arc/MetJ-type ribon-helix-helix transcriptional regulator
LAAPLASRRPSVREGPELQRRAEAAFRADRFADAAEYARHAVRRFAADDPRRASLLRLRRESLARIGGIDQDLTTREAEEPAVP